jgi:ATP/ADP translocase
MQVIFDNDSEKKKKKKKKKKAKLIALLYPFSILKASSGLNSMCLLINSYNGVNMLVSNIFKLKILRVIVYVPNCKKIIIRTRL